MTPDRNEFTRGRGVWMLATLIGVAISLAVAVVILSPQQRLVAAPMLASVVCVIVFIGFCYWHNGEVPLGDIGFWHVSSALLYTALPLLVYLLLRFEYTVFSDARLLFYQPTPATVAGIGWSQTMYLAAFSAVYLPLRHRWAAGPVPAQQIKLSQPLVVSVITFWLFANLFRTALLQVQGVRAADYVGSYAVIQALPLGLAQADKVFVGMRTILNIAVALWIFEKYRRRKVLLYGWVVIEAVRVVLTAGARTPLMILIVVALILYHLKIRRFRLRQLIGFGVFGVLLFTALGYYRVVRTITAGSVEDVTFSAGEFDSLFGNSIDVLERKAAGELTDLPAGFALLDLAAIVPSQLLPTGSKTTPSDWYLDQFYPELKERGGGLAFGVVSQSIAGAGTVELIVRAVVLAWLYALLLRWYVRHPSGFWTCTAYLWLTIFSYQSFRATTFHMAPLFVHQFLPTTVAVGLAAFLIRGATATAPSISSRTSAR